MRNAKLLGLSVVVAALAATPSFAQTTSPTSPTRPSTAPPAASGSSTRAAMPSDINEMKASDLIGKNVYNANNERVGEIDDVVVGKTGNQTMAVIGVGGFLGIGEKKAAVPLNQLKVQGDRIVGASLSKDELKSHPEYKTSDYEKFDRNRTVGSSSGTNGTMGTGSSSGTTGTGSTGSGGSSSGGSSTTTPKQ